ncbi:MAG TPA: SHOCT domain-containing protein [Anaerolineae bacterium]|nr:SHOCT domain-containing protein [Anaerolineae bacterium]
MSLSKPSGVVLLLIWCLFMGVTAISIGFGAAFPALNRLAGPVVCSNGQMRVDEQTYRPSPGTTVTTMDWMCVDNKTGEAQPVNELSMFLFNGLIYGLILFGVIMLGYWIATKRRAQRVAVRSAVDDSNSYTSVDLPAGAYPTSLDTYELHELTRQYKEGQFSEKEYQRKRKEILDRVANRADATSPTPHSQLESFKSNELQELMRMYAAGQFSDIEYWQKLNKMTEHTVGQPTAENSAEVPEVEELRKLKSLRDEGLITQQDYDQKKTEILSRM